jgi:hypothetical protein
LRQVEKKILRIKVHGASRPTANRSLQSLFDQLNETGIQYPGTDMQLVYELGGGYWWLAKRFLVSLELPRSKEF